MKALELQAIEQLEMVDAPVPSIEPDQMLIRTGAAVICTSDLHDIRANPFKITLPVVMGHEGAGTVEQVGANVRGFAVGDRVATHPVHPCGQCPDCRAGRGHVCPTLRHFGLTMPGTFAEHYVVRSDRARKLSPDIPFERAALAEPICVCLQALAQARLKAGDRLLIIGDGPFGVLMAILARDVLARDMNLGTVVVLGRHDYRLDRTPATTVRVNTKKVADPMAVAREHAGASGYDAVILAVGSADAFEQGQKLLRPKGRLVVFSPIMGKTPIDVFDISCRELEIVGACNDEDRLDDAVAALASYGQALDQLVTHRFTIDQYREAFACAAGGHDRALKVALSFGA